MLTKRQLGLLLLLAGLGVLAFTLAIDLIRPGSTGGFGPYQTIGSVGGGLLAVLGLSLVPFGNRPA